MTDLAVYVHFPWCAAKCPYCDFVSYVPKGTAREDAVNSARVAIDHGGYADAVIRELEARAPAFDDRAIGSVFFGGGTPSLWEPEQLGRVLAAIRERWSFGDGVEVTVECNPTSLDRERASALRAVGVNRLSIGTQSLRAEQLKFLGRLHDPAGATSAVRAALEVSERVSTDMIFGLPEQSPEDARDQAIALASLGLSHLSCYQLTIEPGTQFGELAKRGRLPLADDGRVAESFLAIDEALGARGLRHYEISNYAAPGEEARHNVAYWRGGEYVGLGCGAFGFARKDGGGGVRYRNAIDPAKYADATRSMNRGVLGELDGLSVSSETLDAEALLRERIMLGLRLEGGLDLEAAALDLGTVAWTDDRKRAAEKLVAAGRLAFDAERTFIPRAAWIWTDDTAARLF
jgi:oxygen-independent coproporphyrinogen-3 oxidase